MPASLQLLRDGVAVGPNVRFGLYLNHTVYYKNTAGNWFTWNGALFVATTDPREAAEGVTLTTTTGSLYDGAGTQWSLVTTPSGWMTLHNGLLDGANITKLQYHAHTVYRVNNASAWERWVEATASWTPTTDPSVVVVTPDAPTISVLGTPTASDVTIAFVLAITGPQIDSGGVRVLYKLHTDSSYSSGPLVPIATLGNGTVTDIGGNVWSIGTDGKLYVGAAVQSETSGVVMLSYVGGRIQQKNTFGDWYSKALPSDTSWSGPTQASPFATIGVTVTPLLDGKLYDFTSYAISLAGNGVQGNVVPATTAVLGNVPGQPSLALLGSAGSTSVTLSCTPPASGGALDAGLYQIQSKQTLQGSTYWTNGPSASYCTQGVGSVTDGNNVTWSIVYDTPNATWKLTRSDTGMDGGTNGVVFAEVIGGTLWQKNNLANWYSSAGAAGNWNGPQTTDPLYGTGLRVTGLAQTTSYDFRCYVTNSQGNGPYSSVVQATTTTQTAGTGFTVSGGEILKPDGTTFKAQGFSILSPQLGPVAASDCKPLLTWLPYLNICQISSQSNYYGATSVDGTAFINQIDQVVTWLTAKNIVVVIGNYINTDTNGNTPIGTGTSPSRSNVNAWVSAIAKYYKDNPYVWLCAGPNEGLGGTAISQQHRAEYDAWRGSGTDKNDNPILFNVIGGPSGSSGNPIQIDTSAATYSTMTNVVWSIHPYGWMPGSFGKAENVAADDDSMLQSMVTAAQGISNSADGVMPVMAAEFGNANGNNASINGDTLFKRVIARMPVIGCGYIGWMAPNWGGYVLPGGTGTEDNLINPLTGELSVGFGDYFNANMNSAFAP